MIKATYEKVQLTILNGEKLKVFTLRSGRRQEGLLLQLLINIVQFLLADLSTEEQDRSADVTPKL